MAEQLPEELVLRDLDDRGVLLLTWNRPERNNAWTLELEDAYFDALTEAAVDPAVKVVVVTGAGRSFCPGMDDRALAAAAKGDRDDRPRRSRTFALKVPKPIVAAVNGGCAGIGLVQALVADVRFAASSAKFNTAFARRGLPAENGISWMLPRIVGTGRAMDLLLSSRIVRADEALAIGLVERVTEPEQLVASALEYAADIAANCSPASLAAMKHQVHADAVRTIEESRRAAVAHVKELMDQPDFAEAINAYLEKRAPSFEGLSTEI